MKPCEACERASAESVEPCDDPDEPYHLCLACHKRLHARALRPLEWYNLAKRHGWYQFLLHDDFYDEDGTACQPDQTVDHPEDFPAPSLAVVAHDPPRLLDYSITRWHLTPEDTAAWSVLPRAEVLRTLSERFGWTKNPGIRSRLLEICAAALQETGADFVRYAWGDYPATVGLSELAEASAACLPFREGISRVTTALAKLSGSRKRELMFSLGYFHSQEALDWIEHNFFEPTSEAWGYLAAASQLDWPRVESWLEQGRPLSLVAIDALGAIVRPQSPFLRAYGPSLKEPPSRERLVQVLSAYADRDPVPRVQQRTTWLLSHLETLTNGD
ncbi:MAG TPA: hypothetical protein VGE67_09390 [Haloferula sp.]